MIKTAKRKLTIDEVPRSSRQEGLAGGGVTMQ